MNRFLRSLFLGLAALLAVGIALYAWYLQTAGGGGSWLHARGIWALLAGVLFFSVAAWRFSVQAKFRVFLLLFAFFVIEMVLQAAGWLGILPAVNTKEYLPWARVYWTTEGRGNSIRNRHGWHFPSFNLEKTNRVGIIGDSFVEAVEVHRTRNMSALLRDKLDATDSQRTVLGLGRHGTGPAQYLEVLKYAHRRFAIHEAILVIHLGSDITDASPKLQMHDPEQFLYYSLGADGALRLDAAGERARAAYVRNLEILDRPPWLFLPRVAVSHCMSVQLPLSVANTRAMRKRIETDAAHHLGPEVPLARLGLKGAPFLQNPTPEAREGFAIVQALLDQADEFCRTNGIKLRLVTIPSFPPDFYLQPGPTWTARLGDYDFLAPDRELGAWAARHHVPFLPLGERMSAQRLTPKDIHALYLSDGSGHFTEAGHRFAAESMQAMFFSRPEGR